MEAPMPGFSHSPGVKLMTHVHPLIPMTTIEEPVPASLPRSVVDDSGSSSFEPSPLLHETPNPLFPTAAISSMHTTACSSLTGKSVRLHNSSRFTEHIHLDIPDAYGNLGHSIKHPGASINVAAVDATVSEELRAAFLNLSERRRKIAWEIHEDSRPLSLGNQVESKCGDLVWVKRLNPTMEQDWEWTFPDWEAPEPNEEKEEEESPHKRETRARSTPGSVFWPSVLSLPENAERRASEPGPGGLKRARPLAADEEAPPKSRRESWAAGLRKLLTRKRKDPKDVSCRQSLDSGVMMGQDEEPIGPKNERWEDALVVHMDYDGQAILPPLKRRPRSGHWLAGLGINEV
ncbi:uncharacterized protein BCR38DRAFT_170128 [Pseudomassariella vexata]|uniref:Uncharacterized protein n=1 Tax=Pseudomassariella vexata TaxID=1141098 RepID=A0A1Y2E338_9PEZI|nr:uncharacterized protein BCR38DRAFT_170128 [Pseudomassariella vexata]ORY65958.1 hypothetical protein BCR38DRAFT_170128 [Pseudomassariella vexata]